MIHCAEVGIEWLKLLSHWALISHTTVLNCVCCKVWNATATQLSLVQNMQNVLPCVSIILYSTMLC